jgi:hypothetical protein
VRIDLRYGSNAVRLSAAQWLIAAALVLAAVLLAPALWEKAEPFSPGPDYRIPYSLSSDYWLFSRYARAAAARGKTLVLGDSVIWGQYVAADRTLSHFLNQETGGERFANFGLDGAHPAALAGLVEYYGGDLAGRDVVLHCNLLWTASKKHDLAEHKEFQFNHPALVPQFVPWIPCYTETLSRRIGIVIERHVTFSAWADHLRLAYLGQMDLAAWTLEHPCANPLAALQPHLVAAATDRPQHDAAPWTERGIPRQSFDWVDLDTSLQWCCFRRTVEVLRKRGSRVFVLVGPFNEHLLEPASLAVYAERKRQVAAWLRESGVPCLVPETLPSPLYADASHPLAEGYALLARRLIEDNAFAPFGAGPSN